VLTAEKALVNPALLILFQKLFFCYLLPRHPLLEIEVDGVVKDTAKNKVMMGKDRNAHDMPVSIFQGAGQIILHLEIAQRYDPLFPNARNDLRLGSRFCIPFYLFQG
jgi:hypothetical protein